MKKTKVILSTVVILGLVVAVLMYNKTKMAAKSKPSMLTAIPVSVQKVGQQQLSTDHSLVGTIAGRNDVAIVSETQGKITGVTANIGDRVRAGSVIMQVDDELKKASFLAAEVNYEKAKKDLERQESLYKQQSATDAQLEGARLEFKSIEAQYILARRQYNDAKITSPIDGIVTSRPVNVGTYVQSGNVVANVVDISSLKVKLNVTENDVFQLKVGERVLITTEIYPGITFEGTIYTISAKGDESHTYPVEITLKNSASHPLKAGMFARVAFTSLNERKVPMIPRQALVGSVKKPQAYVVDNGTAHLREIVVGSEAGSMLEVLQGIREGEIVVVNGQNNLKDNVAVEIIQ